MWRALACVTVLTWSSAAAAEVPVGAIVDGHVIPGFARLSGTAAALDATAAEHCAPGDPELRAAWSTAFDAWVMVSHLRFGPTEAGDRAFALAFWPDSRGVTPKALAALIAAKDPAVASAGSFAAVSVAARGFYALEYLLYDPAFAGGEAPEYRCALVRAIAGDIARVSADILSDWQDRYAGLMTGAGGNDTYRSRDEAAQELFKALSTGLQFTSDTRLGRPLGTFDKPRPTRAEAWRSGRSLRHVVLSLEGTRALALGLAADDPETAAALNDAYRGALAAAAALDDPAFAGVATPEGRLKAEILQQAVDRIRGIVAQRLGPGLGVAAGFNALDGD